jgi:hypothetical protein
VSSPAPSGRASRLRLGGLALIGLAVVAAIMGLFLLATGGGDGDGQTAAPPPPSDGTPGPDTPGTGAPGAPGEPGTGAPPTTGDGAVPGPPSAPPPAPGAGTGTPPADGSGAGTGPGGAPGAPGPGDGSAGAGGPGAATAPLRVYNNSTISGLAGRAADEFRSAGWPVEEVSNYPSGIIPTSTVYYRPGTGEKASAEAMSSAFGLRVEPRFDGLADAAPGLIVIVTNDYGTDAGTRK